MKNLVLSALLAASCLLAGCATFTPTSTAAHGNAKPMADSALLLLESKPVAGKSRDDLLTDITEAARLQLPQLQANRFRPHYPLPDVKPSFKLVDPYANTYSGALRTAFSGPVKMPVCDNSILSIRGEHPDALQTGDSTTLFICVMQFNGGYRTAVYVTRTKTANLITTVATSLNKDLASVNHELFIPQTISAVRQAVERNTADTKVVDPQQPNPASTPQ